MQEHPKVMLYKECDGRNIQSVIIRDEWSKMGVVKTYLRGKLAGTGFCKHDIRIVVNRAAYSACQGEILKVAKIKPS